MLNGLITLCISALLWLPLLQYSNLSSRSQMGLADRMLYSVPVDRLTGLIFPEIFGNWELWVYVGVLGVISAIGLLFNRNRPTGSTFWLWVSLISLIWAFGINNPLMHLISELPGFSLLRVPSRSMFIFGLSACLLIGFFCDLVFKRIALQKGLRLTIFAITAFEIFLTLAVRISTDEWNLNFLWGAVVWVLVDTVLFLLDRFPTMPVSLGFGFLLFLQLLDLGGLNLVKSKFYTTDQLPDAKPSLVEWLKEQDGDFRVYSPSYSISQLNAAKAGLELADGISPLHVQSYDRFMVEASGVKGTGYSVNIPPFRTGNPDTDNMKAIPSAGLLGILNVRYLCSEFPVDAEGFEFVEIIDGTYIYENRHFRSRAWLQSSKELDETGGNLLDAEIEFIEQNPNSIQVKVSGGGGHLVLSEITYPGWQVTVDQKPAELVSIEGLLRGVEVPDGNHEVVFRFRPLTVYLGAAISLLSVAGGFICLLILRKRRGSHV